MGFLNGICHLKCLLRSLCLTSLLLTLRIHAWSATTYIVHMDKSFMPKAFASHLSWYSSIVDSLRSTGNPQSSPSLIYSYDSGSHGFSAVLSAYELEKLKMSPGFVSAYPDRTATVDTTHTPEFLSLNSYSGLWPASNYGEDVIIGVIDSGVWPESLDEAIHDGVDVISISMGFDGVPLYEDPIAIASFAAMEKGDGKTIPGKTLFPATALVQDLALIYNKTLSACNSSVMLSNAPGGIIICDNTGSLYTQISEITVSRVRAAIFISDEPEPSGMPCPGVVISTEDSLALIKYVTSNKNAQASIKFQQTILGTKPAPTVASYSSRAMGAGQIDPNQALDPGLIYDATPRDYVNLMCSMNFTQKQIMTITRSKSYNCSNPSSDLNYPSFIVLYDPNMSKTTVKTFQRTVTNVGEGSAIYKVKIAQPEGSTITVSPETLVFGKTYEKQSFSVTITYSSNSSGKVPFGEVVWVEENGKHKVRSPVVVSPVVNF
ncbi:hypothetical protein V6N11_003521 [Hibiscus sabdariffa]|uniref:Subtilisin-like protease SBT1.9 n=1 Tax=Hibiscus sabdariffa TaxID=183260 RepID=A0ABR2SEE6_9ROSI